VSNRWDGKRGDREMLLELERYENTSIIAKRICKPLATARQRVLWQKTVGAQRRCRPKRLTYQDE